MCPLWSVSASTTSASTIMLVITRFADGKTLVIPRAPQTLLTREELMMGDVRPFSPTEPTSYISQNQPVKVYIDANGVIIITNKQPFLLYRDGELRTHHGDLENVQASDRVCFCPRRITERHYATFLFRLTPDASDTVEEEDEQKEEQDVGVALVDLDDFELPYGWRTKKRKRPFTTPPVASSSGSRRCGKCGKVGHNRQTCWRRM